MRNIAIAVVSIAGAATAVAGGYWLGQREESIATAIAAANVPSGNANGATLLSGPGQQDSTFARTEKDL